VPRELAVIGVPFHAGRRAGGLAQGPEAIIGEVGARAAWVEDPREVEHEAARIFSITSALAGLVSQAVTTGRFPLVVTGNCNAALGVTAGMRPADVGIVWFDAHGDFNTPDTSTSGFFDGTALATVTGGCWRAMASSVPGFAPVPEASVVLAGVRDTDPLEQERLDASAITVVPPGAALEPALDALAGRCEVVYLHVDVDVLDPSVAAMNQYAAPGGLTLEALVDAIGAVAARLPVGAASVSAFNPEVDGTSAARTAAAEIMRAVAAAA